MTNDSFPADEELIPVPTVNISSFLKTQNPISPSALYEKFCNSYIHKLVCTEFSSLQHILKRQSTIIQKCNNWVFP